MAVVPTLHKEREGWGTLSYTVPRKGGPPARSMLEKEFDIADIVREPMFRRRCLTFAGRISSVQLRDSENQFPRQTLRNRYTGRNRGLAGVDVLQLGKFLQQRQRSGRYSGAVNIQ
jgi:hypothetical protein